MSHEEIITAIYHLRGKASTLPMLKATNKEWLLEQLREIRTLVDKLIQALEAG